MKVLICGGRHFKNRNLFWTVLDSLTPAPTLLICGTPRGTIGVDKLAQEYGKEKNIPLQAAEAVDFEAGNVPGPPSRLLDSKPDLVISFAGRTKPTPIVRRALALGVGVIEVTARGRMIPKAKERP